MNWIINKLKLMEKLGIKEEESLEYYKEYLSREEELALFPIDEECLYKVHYTSDDDGWTISYLKKKFDLERKQKENILLTADEVKEIIKDFFKYILEHHNDYRFIYGYELDCDKESDEYCVFSLLTAFKLNPNGDSNTKKYITYRLTFREIKNKMSLLNV